MDQGIPQADAQRRNLDRRRLMALGTASVAASLLRGGQAAAQGTDKLSLVVGTSPPDPACHYLYYAREMNFYRDNGLEVDIKGLVSATNATRAVVSGEADVGWPDVVSAVIARDVGAKIKVVSGFARKLDYVIVGNAGVGSIADLQGKRFAVATIGGGTYVIPRAMSVKAAGDPTKIQFVALGNSSARAQALIAGTVDATIITSSFIPRILTYPQLRVVAKVSEGLPDFAYTWEIANEAVIRARRPAIEGFVVALGTAVKWAEANPDQAADLSVKLLPDADKTETRNAIKAYLAQHFWTRDGEVPKQVVDFTVASLLDAGQIKRQMTFDEIVDADVMGAAAAKLRQS